MSNNTVVRKGCKDIWNAYMAKDATFCNYDIPFCPTTASCLPKQIITWEEAKQLYQKQKSKADFSYDAFVCFYIDDYKFDSTKGIWFNPQKTLKILHHFSGAITPDFSTYQDFPYPIKLYATYRMRLFGKWLGENGINVINNIRWGDATSFSYCYEGAPKNSIVAIGTVGGNPRKLIDRERFEEGLYKMVEVLNPHTILVYGSANYSCFQKLKEKGIKVISYKSKTAKVFESKNNVA